MALQAFAQNKTLVPFCSISVGKKKNKYLTFLSFSQTFLPPLAINRIVKHRPEAVHTGTNCARGLEPAPVAQDENDK